MSIEVDLDDPQTVRLWTAVGELAERLPGEWTLIGGLMVQLHAIEHGITDVRATIDIDILGQARPQGALTSTERRWLRDAEQRLNLDRPSTLSTATVRRATLAYRLLIRQR